MTPTTLRISDVFLVNEVTRSELGLHYERTLLSEERIGDREERRFETLRVYENKPEALRARAVYEQARSRLRKVCSKTALGLVCPVAREAELDEAIRDIEGIVATANRDLRVCRIDYSVVPIRILADNTRAQEALAREVRSYAEQLLEATRSLDPQAIRRVLRAGRGMETLVEDASLRAGLEQMGEAAQKAAREMVKAVDACEGDESAAKSSSSVRHAAEEVARRFPWADAFAARPSTAESAEVAA